MGPHSYTWAFLELQQVHGLLTAVLSHAAEQRLQTCGLSSCGSQALEPRFIGCGLWDQLPCSMWDLPGRGIEPMPLTLQGRFLTTGTPGKPLGKEFKFFSTHGAIQTFYFFGYPFW